MSKPTITHSLAMSAGRDAGNRSMREGGRSMWSVKDWNVACETFEQLWPEMMTKSDDLSPQKPLKASKGIRGRVEG